MTCQSDLRVKDFPQMIPVGAMSSQYNVIKSLDKCLGKSLGRYTI